MYKSLVLAGCGMKAFLMLGALEALRIEGELDLGKIREYIGTSAGSMVAYLLAIGYTPIEILVYLCKTQAAQRFPMKLSIDSIINKTGVFDFAYIEMHLMKMTMDKIGYIPTFMDLRKDMNIRFVSVTYNITEHKMEYISCDTYPNLKCIEGVHMSSNIPLIFSECIHNSCMYVDGGIVNNFPVDIDCGLPLLAVGFQREVVKFESQPGLWGLLQYMYHLMFIPLHRIDDITVSQAKAGSRLIRLPTFGIKLLNFKISLSMQLDMFTNGYNHIKNKDDEKQNVSNLYGMEFD